MHETQADREREDAHQQSQKLAAQLEKTRQKAESKRIKTREAEEKKTKGGKGASGMGPGANEGR
jgi:outer membrane protein TolC